MNSQIICSVDKNYSISFIPLFGQWHGQVQDSISQIDLQSPHSGPNNAFWIISFEIFYAYIP